MGRAILLLQHDSKVFTEQKNWKDEKMEPSYQGAPKQLIHQIFWMDVTNIWHFML